MGITTDWHIHSRHSCECHEIGMTMAEIAEGAARAGIADFGVTDHLHSRYNLPDLVASRREFDALRPSPRFHFGAEVTCLRRWELDEIDAGRHRDPVYGIGQEGPESEPALALTEADVRTLGIEFVVGGVHWARGIPPEPARIIGNFHRQMLFLATHPLVDIVAHPWWWHDHFRLADGRYVPGPWTRDFAVLPRSLHEEFAAAAVANGTAVEINHPWVLSRPFGDRGFEQYLEYLLFLKERGVKFSTGADSHARPYRVDVEAAARLLERLRLRDGDLWRLPPRG